MKSFLYRIIAPVVLLLCLNSPAEASHFQGGHLTYECTNTCTTRVKLTLFRDCGGTVFSLMDANSVVFDTTGTGCVPPAPIGNWSIALVNDVTPICPTLATRCTNGSSTINGVEVWEMIRDYDHCAASPGCVYPLSFTSCCRNGSLTNIFNPSTQGIYIVSTYNTGLSGCNSSPQWSDYAKNYVCSGAPMQLDFGAFDPDGDSLSFSLSPIYTTATTLIPYAPTYNAAVPMGPSWQLSIDEASGLVSIVPQPGNIVVGVLGVVCEEWRNGVIINTYLRESDVVVIPCPNNTAPPQISAISNVQGAVANATGDTLTACTGSQLCFDLSAVDPNGSSVDLYWNGQPLGATFTDVNNVSVQDTIRGLNPQARFCWTPGQMGTYHLLIRANDADCPVPSMELASIVIEVGQLTNASATLNGCQSALFEALACGGSGNFTFQWSGANGLSSTAASFSHSYSGAGSYPWQCVISDGASIQDTIRDTVVVGGPSYLALISGSGPIDPCNSVNQSTLAVGGGYTNYIWSQGANSSSIVVNQPGTYGVTVTDANACQYFDSIQVVYNAPDISGTIQVSSQLAPLANQRVYLIKFDPLLQTLTAVDTTYTDAGGFYKFCSVTDSVVFVKAAPDSANYPTEMPTYADSSLVWNQATPYSALTLPYLVNFATIFGQNPGGSGFIGGLISQGANKTSGPGDPVGNLSVFLKDDATGSILDHAVTDANGYFSFRNIPFGNYRIVPDQPGVDEQNVPLLSISSSLPNRDSLDFRLHSSYLELVIPSSTAYSTPDAFSLKCVPNPFGSSTEILLHLPQREAMSVEVYDLRGRKVLLMSKRNLEAGLHRIAFDPAAHAWASGIFFVRIHGTDHVETMKLFKSKY